MKVDLEELERKARAATRGAWNATEHAGIAVVADVPCDDSCTTAGCLWGSHPAVVVRLDAVSLVDAEHIASADPTTVIALIVRIRELEVVAALAYDMTHEEGALELRTEDTVDAEDIDKIERMSDALLQLGKLYRKGVVLP